MSDTINLDRFCDPDGIRQHTLAPYAYGGWLYATDDKICVRVPSNTKAPRVSWMAAADSLFADFPLCRMELGDVFAPYVKRRYLIDDAEPVPSICGCDDWCKECEGSGTKTCSRCDGDGDEPPRFESTCTKCDGDGGVFCETCGGKGYDLKATRCEFCSGPEPRILALVHGGGYISRRYWLLIRDLPNLRVAPVRKEAVPFTFDGGQGLVMTIRAL